MPDILSVGIDIGTSTTQLVFSRMTLKNTGAYFAVPRVSIVQKEVVYTSRIYTTPLLDRDLIDGDKLREIIAAEYAAAGYRPEDVNTGAAIITGESARKENAARVLDKISSYAGEFVISTAGPDLESVIAGKGSGAWQHSQDEHCRVANLDIGGGTTNIVIFDRGRAVARGCYDIGGRLIRTDGRGRIERISPAARKVAESLGIRITEGQEADPAVLKRITDRMAELLAQVFGLMPRDPLLESLRTPGSSLISPEDAHTDLICFSGGVADGFSYTGTDPMPYDDIGILLARSLQEGRLVREIRQLPGRETIRATVVGAGTYTTSISGSTITVADEILPIQNVPALRLTEEEQRRCALGERHLVSDKIRWFLEQSGSDDLVLALPGMEDPDYMEVRRLAETLAADAEEGLPAGAPLLVVLEKDMAKVLGILLEKELKGRRKVACIDGISVEDGDYVDMGRPVMNGLVIPVIVKTLVFGQT